MTTGTSATFGDSKPHYLLLDGLRGVAALLVVWYHVHEGFAFASGAAVIEGINHGYLAVDFFFMLSGFVIGYAYDGRLDRDLSVAAFFRRRLVRLHPMVIAGAVAGVVAYLLQGGVTWDGRHVEVPYVMGALLCAMLFIPVFPGMGHDVRGNGEAFPLNGPAWSLFFEYIGNIAYALLIRRCSTKIVAALALLLGLGLASLTIFDLSGAGSLGVGWSMGDNGFLWGSLRMLFPFTAGILLSRVFRPMRVRGVFWICSAVLIALFHVPYIASGDLPVSLNGVYEIVCIAFFFPLVVRLGASGSTPGRVSGAVCRFLGDISYPLYITHYPVMYLFYDWMIKSGRHTLADTWPQAVGVCGLCVAIAWLCLKLYDIPVRRYLTRSIINLSSSRSERKRPSESTFDN